MRAASGVAMALVGALALGACSSSGGEAKDPATTTSLGEAARQVPFAIRVGDTEALGERWKIQVSDATVTDTRVTATVVLLNDGSDAFSLEGIGKAFTLRKKLIGADEPVRVTSAPATLDVAPKGTLTVEVAADTTFAKGDDAILFFHGQPFGAHDATVDLREHV